MVNPDNPFDEAKAEQEIRELKQKEQELVETPGFTQDDAERQQELNQRIKELEQKNNVDSSQVKIQESNDEPRETRTAVGVTEREQRTGQADAKQDKANAEDAVTNTENQREFVENSESQEFTVTENGEEKTISKNQLLDNLDQQQQRAQQAVTQADQNLQTVRRRQKRANKQNTNTVQTSNESGDNEAVVDALTRQQGPAMTAPGQEVQGLRPGTGLQNPSIGRQEFASGTENINADFREELRPDIQRESNFNALDFGVSTGETTSSFLQDLGISESQSDFFGEQTGKIATVGASTVSSLDNIDEAVSSAIESPGQSIERARSQFERDVRGVDADELTDADVTAGIAASGTNGVSRSSIRQGAGDFGVLLDTASLTLGGGSSLRRADDFVLRSPVRQVDNPTPDIPGVRTLDQKLEAQIPIERREVTEFRPEQLTSTSDRGQFQSFESSSTFEALEREFRNIDNEDLPDLGQRARPAQEFTDQAPNQDELSATGDAPRRVARRRGEPIGEPEQGLTQQEVEVLADREVGFEDVNPERQTDTGGFERQQVDELQARAERPSDDGLSRFVDEIRDNFGTSKGQVRLTNPEPETRIRDVDIDQPDLNRPRDLQDSDNAFDTIENRRQNNPDLDSSSPLDFDNPAARNLRDAAASSALGLDTDVGEDTAVQPDFDQVQNNGQGQNQRNSQQEEQIFDDFNPQFDDISFNNPRIDNPNNRDIDRIRNSDPEGRRRRDKDLPERDSETDFFDTSQLEDDFVGTDLQDQFATSLTAGLQGIEAGEDFDEDQTFTGFDIRPLL